MSIHPIKNQSSKQSSKEAIDRPIGWESVGEIVMSSRRSSSSSQEKKKCCSSCAHCCCDLGPVLRFFAARDKCVTAMQVIVQLIILGVSAWSIWAFRAKYFDATVVQASKRILIFAVVAAALHSLMVFIQWTVMIISTCYRHRESSPSSPVVDIAPSTAEERERWVESRVNACT